MRQVLSLIILIFFFGTTSAANYLTFTAEVDSSSFGIKNIEGNNPNVRYSLDGGKTWVAFRSDTLILLRQKGDKALLRGNNPQGFSISEITPESPTANAHSKFVMTGRIAASGSVMSLIDGVGESTVIPNDGCFRGLFIDCESLTKAPELPATTLAENCYAYMFYNCTSLIKTPDLPATTLAKYCYWEMFYNCTSLIKAPDLPATIMEYCCYASMFQNCNSLTQAPELPATTLAKHCYNSMFKGCSNLTQAPALPATELKFCCYEWMFASCTSLEKAPELPAKELAARCYRGMFFLCTNLTQAPRLPATTLAPWCYRDMFRKCSKINFLRVSFTDWGEQSRFAVEPPTWDTDSWVYGVASNGTFICPVELPEEFWISRIPEGWKVLKTKD